MDIISEYAFQDKIMNVKQVAQDCFMHLLFFYLMSQSSHVRVELNLINDADNLFINRSIPNRLRRNHARRSGQPSRLQFDKALNFINFF